jgi:hypothetical protein
MEYLDQPEHDETSRAHPAFWRGKNTGINAVLEIVSNIMMGHDDGSGSNNHHGIESMRQGLLTWKKEVDKFKPAKTEKSVEK